MAPTFRRRLGALAAASAVAGLAATAIPASATASFRLARVAGADRYATAAAVAGDAFPGTSATALIARGDQFADALAGAYLGGVQTGGAPVLLTETNAVPASTRSRLSAMGAKNVILLGGTSAISTAVEQDLDANYEVTRQAGANRYDTAAKIAQAAPAADIGQLDGKRTAIVASGESFPDALAAGPLSFSQKFPILLTRPGQLPAETRAAIAALGITNAVVVGGTGAVSSAVVSELTAAGVTSTRVAGSDRYDTAAKVADFALSRLAGWSTTAVDLATGESFADALAGGPAAGRTKRAILLTASSALSAPTSAWLKGKASTLTGGRVVGGTTAVADSVKAAAEAAGGADSTQATGQVTATNPGADRYTFVPNGGSEAQTVTYKATDRFTVGGLPADISGFEANLSTADFITYTTGADAKHDLVNVEPSSITSGTIGNIDAAQDQLDFIHPVTGTILRENVPYAPSGATYSIDGVAEKTAAQFELDVNEGDALRITGGAFALTNQTVSGPAGTITKPSSAIGPQRTTLMIGALGDDPTPGLPNDATFVADGADKFTGAVTTYAAFQEQVSDGDTVTYRRVGGEEHWTLTNQVPATITGQAVDGLNANGGLAGDAEDGGSFTIATSTGSTAVTYRPSAQFVVNGVISTEGVFEQRYSAGDAVSFRAADAPTNTTERVELTDANLSGKVGAINTGDAQSASGAPANSYAVLAANGTTVLATVQYAAGGTDTYVVNGTTVDLAAFEAELNAIAAGTRAGTVVVERTGTAETHRLTTTNP